MPDPITMTAIGLYACNQAVGFAVNVASDLSMGKWRSKSDYTNHDIPRTVREAWRQAVTSVFNQYALKHDAELNSADRMAIKTGIKELASGAFADAMFLRIEDSIPAEAMDLSGNPLPALTSNEKAIEAGHQLVKALREHAKTKPLLSKVPENFYDHCAEHLVCAMSYFYVEIAIKDDEKACKQIMYRIAQDSWVLMSQMNEGIERVERGVGRIESGMENLLTASKLRDQKIDTVADYLVGQLQDRNRQIEELRKQVRDAIAAKVAAEEAAGRSADAMLDELRKGDATKLLEFLDRYVDEDERRLIERHRERASVAIVVGDYQRANNSLHKIIDIVSGDLWAINQLGIIAKSRGHFDDANKLFTQVLSTAPNETWRAVALGNLGSNEQRRGNLGAAEIYIKQSLTICEDAGLRSEMGCDLGNLGLIEETRMNFNGATSYFKQALTIDEEFRNKGGIANHLANLGVVEQRQQRLDTAEGYFAKSLDIFRELENKEGMAKCLGNLSSVEYVRGNYKESVEYLFQSIEIHEVLGHTEGLAVNLVNLGLITKLHGHFLADTLSIWTQARDLFSEIGMPQMVEKTQALIDGLDG